MCDEVLCTMFMATKADVTAENEGCEEETLGVEGFDFPFDKGGGVTIGCRVFLDEGRVSVTSGGRGVRHVSLEGSRV